MGMSYGGLGGVYGGGGRQPQEPSGGGTRGFDAMPRQIPAALGNFGPKSGPANNPSVGWSGGVAAPTPIATPNPIGGQIPGYTPHLPMDGGGQIPGYTPHLPMDGGGQIPGYTPPPGWGNLPTDGGGERPMAPPTTLYPPPKNDPDASPGYPQPMPPTTGPSVGPINDPDDPTAPGTGGSSGGNVTGPRPSRFPMPQPKMPRRTDVSFYRPPRTLQPQPAKDPTGGATDPRRTAPIYVRPKFQ